MLACCLWPSLPRLYRLSYIKVVGNLRYFSISTYKVYNHYIVFYYNMIFLPLAFTTHRGIRWLLVAMIDCGIAAHGGGALACVVAATAAAPFIVNYLLVSLRTYTWSSAVHSSAYYGYKYILVRLAHWDISVNTINNHVFDRCAACKTLRFQRK